MQELQQNGKFVRSGIAVVEIYEGEYQIPAGLQDQFEKNPEKLLKDFLQSQGMKVKSLSILRTEAVKASARPRVPPGWYHYVYPDSIRSHWIYIEG